MDPNACFEALLRALSDGDHDQARRRARELAGWLGRGGFPPSLGWTAQGLDELRGVVTRAVIRFVLAHKAK